MVPSGPPTPVGGAQSVPPSLMPTNSELLGAQGGSIASQSTFPSIVSPHGQYGNMMGNMSNISSFLSQSFGNGGSNNGLSGNLQRSSIEMGAESHILSGIGNNMGFSPSSVSFASSNTTNPSSGQDQFPSTSGNQIVQDQRQPQQMDASSFQHGQQSMQQFSIPQNQQQQQFHSIRGAFGGMGPMKLEPQIPTDQNGPQSIQSLRNLGPVKLEQQQMQSLRNMTPVKIEPQHSDQTLFVPQQFLMSRQSPQVAAAAAQMSLLQQQRLLQLQQHQQQQLLKSLPQARPPLQQQFQPNLPVRSTVKSTYEPGMCARRLTQYMCHQQQRPPDNNIEFWRKFVAEYFAPNAKKRWCVSLYGSGRQTTGVFPQEVWHCEICNRKPGRGFVATVEVLPRLCKIKYDSGTLEELLYVDIPREYQNASGQIVLDYEKAIQHSVFEQLRVVRHGQLRIVFSTDLKICSWEFCAMRHEELIPRRAIIPQVSHLGAVAQKHQTASQNASSGLSAQELQANCNLFVQSARQLAKALEVPLVNDLGYTKRYVRCLQISEVVNSMKDLIDFSKKTGAGPIECLINFPRRSVTTSSIHLGQGQQPEEQSAVQNSNIDQNSVQASAMQLATIGNAATSVNTSLNTSNSAPSSTIVGLMHQNSINSRQENQLTNVNSSYGANTVQIPSSGSSSSIPQSQANPPFTSQTPSTSSNLPQAPPNVNTACSQVTQSSEPNSNDAHNSVQQMIQEMIMSSQVNGSGGMMNAGSLGTSDMKNLNRMAQTVGLGNGINGVTGISGIGFGGVGSGPTNGGIRAGMSLNGRIPSISQDPSMNIRQQELSNRMMSGIGTADNFNNLQFEWKSPP